jgi:hypothetical protein
VFKIVSLNFERVLLTYKDALNVTRYLTKDTFKTITRIFLVKHNILKIAFLIPRTQEHFKTSTLNLRYKRLTLFVLIS